MLLITLYTDLAIRCNLLQFVFIIKYKMNSVEKIISEKGEHIFSIIFIYYV